MAQAAVQPAHATDATAPTAGTLNGIDVTQLAGILDQIQQTPALARFQFRARNRWIDGGHNRSEVQGFYGAGREDVTRARPFLLDADEPALLLGKDQGANAGEYLLHALAACLTGTIVYHAAARGITILEIESRLEGDADLQGFLGLDERVRNGFQGIRVTFRIKADVPEEQLEEILALGPAFSPVFDSLTRGVPVSVALDR